MKRCWFIACGIATQLITAGCGGGDSFASLFGTERTSETFSAFGLGGGTEGSNGGGPIVLAGISEILGGGSGGGSNSSGSGDGESLATPPVATVHHPEPASMALFGGGLLGIAALRRRKARRQIVQP